MLYVVTRAGQRHGVDRDPQPSVSTLGAASAGTQDDSTPGGECYPRISCDPIDIGFLGIQDVHQGPRPFDKAQDRRYGGRGGEKEVKKSSDVYDRLSGTCYRTQQRQNTLPKEK